MCLHDLFLVPQKDEVKMSEDNDNLNQNLLNEHRQQLMKLS